MLSVSDGLRMRKNGNTFLYHINSSKLFEAVDDYHDDDGTTDVNSSYIYT